jgi:hypothetical protein
VRWDFSFRINFLNLRMSKAGAWRYRAAAVFMLTFAAYTSFHLSRKALSNIAGTLQTSWCQCNTNSSGGPPGLDPANLCLWPTAAPANGTAPHTSSDPAAQWGPPTQPPHTPLTLALTTSTSTSVGMMMNCTQHAEQFLGTLDTLFMFMYVLS